MSATTPAKAPCTSKAISENQQQHSIILPDDASLVYLAEGAANIVYRVILPNRDHGSGSEVFRDLFKGNLLRLRKDLPTTATILSTQAAYLNNVAPLFPSHLLLDQTIISLPLGTTQELNYSLASLSRPRSRYGSSLANETHGLLVKDMSPPMGFQLIEFKPKWLVQSPTAPSNAVRCRTCALRARRNALHYKEPGSQIKSGYCPLDLVSSDRADIQRAAWSILDPKHDNTVAVKNPADPQILASIAKFTDFLVSTPILPLLRTHQSNLDQPRRGSTSLFTDGLTGAMLTNFLLAYTLRDCSVFVLIPDGEGEIIAKIGDLDLKSELKLEKWMDMEQELREEGWYTSGGGEECHLSR